LVFKIPFGSLGEALFVPLNLPGQLLCLPRRLGVPNAHQHYTIKVPQEAIRVAVKPLETMAAWARP
jgi:hypothetical protein